MRIGFDFDKVFVNYPPFVPDFIIDWFYKKKNHNLYYKIPGSLEQKIRILSHHPLLRPQIKENINVLERMAKQKQHEIYLVSGRFGFLKDRTEKWVKRYNVDIFFKKLYFNFSNKQPHLFKLEMIKKLKIKHFIDDDLDLLLFLSDKLKDVKLYWLNQKLFSLHVSLPQNISIIKNLTELELKYLHSIKNGSIKRDNSPKNEVKKTNLKKRAEFKNNYIKSIIPKDPHSNIEVHSK